MKKKLLGLLVGVAIMGGILAGCGSSGSDSLAFLLVDAVWPDDFAAFPTLIFSNRKSCLLIYSYRPPSGGRYDDLSFEIARRAILVLPLDFCLSTVTFRK